MPAATNFSTAFVKYVIKFNKDILLFYTRAKSLDVNKKSPNLKQRLR